MGAIKLIFFEVLHSSIKCGTWEGFEQDKNLSARLIRIVRDVMSKKVMSSIGRYREPEIKVPR